MSHDSEDLEVLTSNMTADQIDELDGDPASVVSPTVTASSSITGVVATMPPQPQHPFYTLPSELILDIVDYLPADAFINFAFANYPLLNSYGLAPALSQPRIMYITTQTRIPALFPLLRMPPEIM